MTGDLASSDCEKRKDLAESLQAELQQVDGPLKLANTSMFNKAVCVNEYASTSPRYQYVTQLFQGFDPQK
jgi:hypothetical protein